jgi:hypothetical protein
MAGEYSDLRNLPKPNYRRIFAKEFPIYSRAPLQVRFNIFQKSEKLFSVQIVVDFRIFSGSHGKIKVIFVPQNLLKSITINFFKVPGVRGPISGWR